MRGFTQFHRGFKRWLGTAGTQSILTKREIEPFQLTRIELSLKADAIRSCSNGIFGPAKRSLRNNWSYLIQICWRRRISWFKGNGYSGFKSCKLVGRKRCWRLWSRRYPRFGFLCLRGQEEWMGDQLQALKFILCPNIFSTRKRNAWNTAQISDRVFRGINQEYLLRKRKLRYFSNLTRRTYMSGATLIERDRLRIVGTLGYWKSRGKA